MKKRTVWNQLWEVAPVLFSSKNLARVFAGFGTPHEKWETDILLTWGIRMWNCFQKCQNNVPNLP